MHPEINHQYLLVEIDKIAQLKKRSEIALSEKAWLGIRGYTSPDPKGVRVVSSEDGSPAAHAGFKSGDLITGIDSTIIVTLEQMIECILAKPVGQTIEIHLYNAFSINERLSTKKVTLGGKSTTLYHSPLYTEMRHNLQYGTIVQIGKKASKEFPIAEVGDILLFNHKVEYKDRAAGDTFYHDYHLIETLPNGNELRIVDYSYEAYGVVKIKERDFTIYPYKKTIFCHQHIMKSAIMMKDGMFIADGWEKTLDDLTDKLEELQTEIDEISKTTVMSARTSERNFSKKEEIFKHIERINKEREEITKEIHRKKIMELTVLFVSPQTCADLKTTLKAGDKLLANYHILYPLDFGGAYFTLVHSGHVEAIVRNKKIK